jgi:pimeloyl-ACP methyl ester carboxylesterase
MSTSVILIHGEFLSPDCWQGWQQRFEKAGYPCLAPAWPGHDRPVAELRREPDPRLRSLGVGDLVDHYASLIAGLPAPPILIGHSIGGLVMQMLLDRGLGLAGVGLAPLPPRGALPGLSLRGPLLVLGGCRRSRALSLRGFSRRVAHTLSAAEQAEIHQRFLVPTARRLVVEAALAIGTAIDFANPGRAPLLLVGGEEDRILEPSALRALYRAHLRSPAETALRLLPRRSHWLLTETGWETLADFCLAWADTHATTV